ncbi:HEAT repeat-containing PBS lyase [Calothrix sp. NIES-4071]|nr:HEAT repeat-containing PBS lyase [Calothrix sp. NIES-4071]BAZ62464.1 HEAT repeat-containing PBS lyase [Calothrix sp. NIES-4105]
MNNISQLLTQAIAARDTADWSSLNQLFALILENSNHPEIVECQEDLLELALLIFERGDFHSRWEMKTVFKRLGSVAIPKLVEILSDDTVDSELRWYTVRILGELKNDKAIPALISLIQTSDDEELRSMASLALGQLGGQAILSLSDLLATEDTRLLATQALCYIRNKDTIAPLLSVAFDSQVTVRAAAIEALSSFHDPRVVPVLLHSLDDESAQVRRTVVTGLSYRRDLHNSELNLVALLQPKLYDDDLGVRNAAAVSLSRIGNDAAASHLYQLLVSQQAPVQLQIETIRALSWVGTISGLEYLQQALNIIKSQTLCEQIVTVLGRVQQSDLIDKAADILLEMLRQNHSACCFDSVKSAIALSLGQLGKIDAVEPLTVLLADSNTQVRLHALAALNNLAPEKQWNLAVL